MYSTTKIQITEIIRKNGQIQVKDLVQILGLTQAAIHRALNKLLIEQILIKKGTPPLVFYFLNSETQKPATVSISEEQKKILEMNYIYITPVGKIESGLDGFIGWMRSTRNMQKPEKCIEDYIHILQEAQSHKNNNFHLINATNRFATVFPINYLNQIFYHDFYSLIKFGKTKMGQFLLHGKQSQNKLIIKRISEIVAPDIKRLIKMEKIDAIAWTPHSIPRKVPFLKELEKNLNLNLPKIEIIKIYSGKIPIAQETMIVVPSKITTKNILLIDDAVGSGATLNEISKKLKFKGAKKIIGYAIVGSYKGFEVIREV